MSDFETRIATVSAHIYVMTQLSGCNECTASSSSLVGEAETTIQIREIHWSRLHELSAQLLNNLSMPDFVVFSWYGRLLDTDIHAFSSRVSFVSVGITSSTETISVNPLGEVETVFDQAQSKRISEYHRTARSAIEMHDVSPVEYVELVSPLEATEILQLGSGIRQDDIDSTFVECFDENVEEGPERCAVSGEDGILTYRELQELSCRIAAGLIAEGAQPGTVVGVRLTRGCYWVASIVGVMRARCVYLPIDPAFPAERVQRMLSISGAELVLTEDGSTDFFDGWTLRYGYSVSARTLSDLVGAPGSNTVAIPACQPSDNAYIYFTSGSTGFPKGALCGHRGMMNHLRAKIFDLEATQSDIFGQTAPICFDISLWQAISALLIGGRTHVISQAAILDVRKFVDAISVAGVSIAQLVPSYLDAVILELERRSSQGDARLPLKFLSVTGEALTIELVNRWFGVSSVPLLNAYGLTETCDDTNHEVIRESPDDGRVLLGRPIRNVRVYILDSHLQLVPRGCVGEIVLAGLCVGVGYVNDPARSIESFVDDQFYPGELMYRSGDFGRMHADGRIEYIGRRDSQIKIRGARVDLRDVEQSLRRIGDVSDCVALLSQGSTESPSLVGFYVAESFDEKAVEAALRSSLPNFMVPAVLVRLQSIPLTENGKVNKRQLQEILKNDRRISRPVCAQDEEEFLRSAWSDVLGLDTRVVVSGSKFSDLGGTSLTAIKLAILCEGKLSAQQIIDSQYFSEQLIIYQSEVSKS